MMPQKGGGGEERCCRPVAREYASADAIITSNDTRIGRSRNPRETVYGPWVSSGMMRSMKSFGVMIFVVLWSLLK